MFKARIFLGGVAVSIDVPRIDVEIFPAEYGDALLVRCICGDRSSNILIDGGLRATFDTQIRTRLHRLAGAGEKLNLVVATHIDNDHIEGLLQLFHENGQAASPKIIGIEHVWHNSYRHLHLKGREPTSDEKQRVLAQAIDPGIRSDEIDKAIGARHGSALAVLLRRYGYLWNSHFGGQAALAGTRQKLGDHLELEVLSPQQQHLDALAKRWRRQLIAMGVSHEAVLDPEFESAFEFELLRSVDLDDEPERRISATETLEPPSPSTFIEDRSVANGSSIALLLEFYGIRALFLGDAFPSVIASALATKRIPPAQFSTDLVKVSHHGSQKSTSPALAYMLRADNFIFSSNGAKFHHPDPATILRIVSRQPSPSNLVFNYPVLPDQLREGLEKRFGHKVIVGDGNHPVLISAHARHSERPHGT